MPRRLAWPDRTSSEMESERFVVRRKERDVRSTGHWQPKFSIAVAGPGLVGIP